MDSRPRGPKSAPQEGPPSDSDEPVLSPDTEAAPAPEELFDSLNATRVLPGPSDGEVPASDAGPPSEGRRAAPGQQGPAQLGDFRLLKKLGEGAMGVVYKARQLGFDRDVALKVLFPHVAANPKLVERFYREARAAGRLDHPNLVSGYEVGEDGGWHFFAMEYVPGKSLQKILATLGRLSVADALHITLRAAAALRHVHEQGLVHRDVKPDNLLINRSGEVKLVDLGMVKDVDDEMGLTQTGHAVGTPWYMPLEQARNAKDADGRCDIYALGCVLYQMLTGQPPFAAKTLVEVIQAKELGTFPPARHANRDVPDRLDLMIAKMTAKLAKHRYAGCAEVIRDLEALGLAGEELSFLAAGGGAAAAAPADVMPAQSTAEPTPLPEPGADVWYVRYKTAQGQTMVRKLTTEQVRALLSHPNFDPSARASRDPKTGFRALATYREFESTVLARATKSGADRRSSRYRKMYEKIEAEDQRKRDRAADEQAATTGSYWLGIFLRCAAVVAGVGVAYALVRGLIALFQ